jgi:predicted DNA-binding antitoxin AbrB/MazE fold protein
MDITIEAIYESGVLKPLEPLEGLNDRDRVRLVLQPIDTVAEQRRERIKLDPDAAHEIGESFHYSPHEFEAALDEFAEGSEAMPVLPPEADDRSFYYEDRD